MSDGALTSVLKGLRNLLAELFTLSQDHTTLFKKKKKGNKTLDYTKASAGERRGPLQCPESCTALHTVGV